jgi:serine/threonine protein kinase
VISQVGQALHWTHQRQLIHRDVKPENILITIGGQAKLTDLGLAKNLKGEFNLTQPLSMLGTPNFMSPEQFEDSAHADVLSDLYSLAATLYMAITGDMPFRGRSANAIATIYKKKLANEIAPPRQFVPSLDEGVETAILKALRADRKERPASVLEFLKAINAESARTKDKPDRTKSAAELSSERERRIKTRYPSGQRATCRPLERVEPWPAKVVNISQTGLCLELGRQFQRGTILQIALSGSEGDRTVVVSVVWGKKHSPRTWQLGCHYDQPLCEFEVEGLQGTQHEEGD